MWGHEFFDNSNTTDGNDDECSSFSKTSKTQGTDDISLTSFGGEDNEKDNSLRCHWQKILDIISDVQLRHKFLPLPTTTNGATYIGGNIELIAERVSMSCMNGEMNAPRYFNF